EPQRGGRARGSPRGPRSTWPRREAPPRPPGGTRSASPKLRAGLFDHLLSGNGGEITGLDLGEPPLGFPEPELFRTRVGLGIEARDEPLGEPRSFLRSQLERLTFQVARSVGHGGQTTTGSMNLMSRMQA